MCNLEYQTGNTHSIKAVKPSPIRLETCDLYCDHHCEMGVWEVCVGEGWVVDLLGLKGELKAEGGWVCG